MDWTFKYSLRRMLGLSFAEDSTVRFSPTVIAPQTRRGCALALIGLLS